MADEQQRRDGMTAQIVDPFLSLAVREPMQLDEYDAIRDDIRDAMHYDRALLPDLFWYAVSTLAVLAQTGAEADNQAATQTLRRMVQRARTGVPMNEPEGEL